MRIIPIQNCRSLNLLLSDLTYIHFVFMANHTSRTRAKSQTESDRHAGKMYDYRDDRGFWENQLDAVFG